MFANSREIKFLLSFRYIKLFLQWVLVLGVNLLLLEGKGFGYESTRSVKVKKDRKVLKKATSPDKIIWFSGSYGYIDSNTDDSALENSKKDYSLSFELGASYITKYAVFDLGLSWWRTKLTPDKNPEVIDEDTPLGLRAKSIETDVGGASAAVLFGSRNLHLGPMITMFYGTDSSFAPEVKDSKNSNVMIGVKGRYIFMEPTVKRKFSANLNVSYLTDLTVDGRRVDIVTAGVGFGLGFGGNKRKIIEKVTKTVYKNRVRTKYKTRTKIKTKIKTRVKKVYVRKVVVDHKTHFVVDAGFVNFETAKYNLSSKFRSYLADLSKLLVGKKNVWNKIIIISHTDKRGSRSYNEQLSLQRAYSVRSELMRNKLTGLMIEVDSKVYDDPVESKVEAVSLARNRRVEILVQGDEDIRDLKERIIDLQQRYQLPGTCHGSICK